MKVYLAWQHETESGRVELLGVFDDFDRAKAACSAWGDVVSAPIEVNVPFGRTSESGLAAYWPDFEWVDPEVEWADAEKEPV